MDLKLEKFARDNVELVPDTMELLTDTELTQYYIQTWSLDYNDPGAIKCLFSLQKQERNSHRCDLNTFTQFF